MQTQSALGSLQFYLLAQLKYVSININQCMCVPQFFIYFGWYHQTDFEMCECICLVIFFPPKQENKPLSTKETIGQEMMLSILYFFTFSDAPSITNTKSGLICTLKNSWKERKYCNPEFFGYWYRYQNNSTFLHGPYLFVDVPAMSKYISHLDKMMICYDRFDWVCNFAV